MNASIVFLALFSFPALAGYTGTVDFTNAEKQAHIQTLQALTATAQHCLQTDLARQQEFITKYRISAFYGDQSSFARKTKVGTDGNVSIADTTLEEKRQSLRDLGFPENYVQGFLPDNQSCDPEVCVNRIQPTSCVGLAMQCLGKGFQAAGQASLWRKIRGFVVQNGSDGDALLTALQKLGWRIYYWTPDTSRLAEWDAQEQHDFPDDPGHSWGYHVANYRTVTTRGLYYFNHVDDYTTMVNFGAGMPSHVRDVPYFVGIAHMGYHVFSGFHGTIIEGHSARDLFDAKTIQSGPFEPLNPDASPGGGPFHSGLVAVPPL